MRQFITSISVEKFITDENGNCFIEFIIGERKKKVYCGMLLSRSLAFKCHWRFVVWIYIMKFMDCIVVRYEI